MVYYSRLTHKLIIDQIDWFLMSAALAAYISAATKNYLSEKQTSERLKRDWIRKAKRKV